MNGDMFTVTGRLTEEEMLSADNPEAQWRHKLVELDNELVHKMRVRGRVPRGWPSYHNSSDITGREVRLLVSWSSEPLPPSVGWDADGAPTEEWPA